MYVKYLFWLFNFLTCISIVVTGLWFLLGVPFLRNKLSTKTVDIITKTNHCNKHLMLIEDDSKILTAINISTIHYPINCSDKCSFYVYFKIFFGSLECCPFFLAKFWQHVVKFMFSKKATKKIFTVDLTVTTYCQIDSEDFVIFCGLLRKL